VIDLDGCRFTDRLALDGLNVPTMWINDCPAVKSTLSGAALGFPESAPAAGLGVAGRSSSAPADLGTSP
jgi:hypothetical protein